MHIYDAYRADLQTQEEFTLELKKNRKQGGKYITDQLTPIHLCKTFELVNKKLVSEYLLYFENCADNATLTFSFH